MIKVSNEEDVGTLKDDKIKTGAKALGKKMEYLADNRETSAEYKADSE
jgi:hypothetical protein